MSGIPKPLFLGNRAGCLDYLRTVDQYYVYILRRPDRRPFYVGKGTGYRVFNHENEASHPNDRKSNVHKLNVIRSIARTGGDLVYEIAATFTDEESAYIQEEKLITVLGRIHEGGPLTNRHPGGGSAREASPYSKAKHEATLSGLPEDDHETAVLNAFVLDIAEMRSVVLKPLSRFNPKPTRKFDRSSRNASLRQAAALAATASINGIPLTESAVLPRQVTLNGVEAFVENGVSRDIVTSGMASVQSAEDALDEQFVLDERQAAGVVGWIGRRRSFDLGLIEVIA